MWCTRIDIIKDRMAYVTVAERRLILCAKYVRFIIGTDYKYTLYITSERRSKDSVEFRVFDDTGHMICFEDHEMSKAYKPPVVNGHTIFHCLSEELRRFDQTFFLTLESVDEVSK